MMHDVLTEEISVLGKTFSYEQKILLLKIYDLMKANGVTIEKLGPLGSLIFLDWSSEVSSRDIDRAKELAAEYKW